MKNKAKFILRVLFHIVTICYSIYAIAFSSELHTPITLILYVLTCSHIFECIETPKDDKLEPSERVSRFKFGFAFTIWGYPFSLFLMTLLSDTSKPIDIHDLILNTLLTINAVAVAITINNIYRNRKLSQRTEADTDPSSATRLSSK